MPWEDGMSEFFGKPKVNLNLVYIDRSLLVERGFSEEQINIIQKHHLMNNKMHQKISPTNFPEERLLIDFGVDWTLNSMEIPNHENDVKPVEFAGQTRFCSNSFGFGYDDF